MNDNDIIKAVEHCAGSGKCMDCPANKFSCTGRLMKYILSLINRQKAEIERLNHIRAEQSKEIDRLKTEMSYMKSPNTIGDTHEMGAW